MELKDRKKKWHVDIKIATALSLFLLLTCFAIFPFLERKLVVSQYFYFRAVGSAATLWLAVRHLIQSESSVKSLNRIDLAVLAYVGYTLIGTLVDPQVSYHSADVLTVLLLLSTYFFFRAYIRNSSFLNATKSTVLVVGLIQLVIGVLQWLRYLPSGNDTFLVTGTFFNPAPYAGFLISILPIALSIGAARWVPTSVLKSQEYGYSSLGIVVAFGILLILPIAASRAAWLGALASVVVVIVRYFSVITWWRTMPPCNTTRPVVTVMFALLGGSVLTLLYYIRPDSALSRLLTWKVCYQMVVDHPVWGVGYGQFFAHFGPYQAAYFQQSPNNSLSSLAGQGEYAFNLFLELLVEQGFVGLGLFTVLIWVALKEAFRNKHTDCMLGGAIVVGILVFGTFSYPFSIIPIQISFFFALALISSYQDSSIRWLAPKTVEHCMTIAMLLVLIPLTYFDVQRFQAHRQWKVATGYKDFFNYGEALLLYDQIYPILKDDGNYLFQYGRVLFYEKEYERAAMMLESARHRMSDTYIYTTLGESYQGLEEYEKAEELFQLAINHNPYRFYPRYLLFQMYVERHQTNKALTIADSIVTMKVKVPSAWTKKIRSEVQKFIDNYQIQKI